MTQISQKGVRSHPVAVAGRKPVLICVICAICGLLVALPARAAEVMPPAPTKYFNDFAGVIKPGTAERLNKSLEQFEKDTSSQIVVAVFPKMESDSSIEDYVNRMFRAWKIGQKQNNNGVLLAVFVQDRKMRIEVGYGLEGAIPDAIAKRIIDNEITPRFRNRDFDGGLSAGVNALIQAARGEYKGTGRTVAQTRGGSRFPWPLIVFGVIFFLIAASSFRRSRRGTVYGRRRSSGWGPIIWTGGGGGWSGGGGGSSGGGFSGGGGSSGGGGASGSW
jgi:uncharacterized protein